MIHQTLARKDLRQALRSWHDSVELGRSPLADLPAAEAARRAGGFSSSDVGRGLALRTALQHALDTLSQIPGLKQRALVGTAHRPVCGWAIAGIPDGQPGDGAQHLRP